MFEIVFLINNKEKINLIRNKEKIKFVMLTNYKPCDRMLLKIKLCNSYQERWRERAL